MRTLVLALISAYASQAQNLNLVWEGSSSTAGTGVTTAQSFPVLTAAAVTGITVHSTNVAAIGQIVGAYAACPISTLMVCQYSTEVAPHLNEYAGQNVLWLQNATNDLCYDGDGVDAATGYGRVLDYFVRANPSWKFVTMTQTPRNLLTVSGATCETRRADYDSRVLTGCGAGKVRIYYDPTNQGAAYRCQPGSPYQYVVDVAADTRIGCAGCQNDTTYYQADGTHGTPLWHQIVAAMVAPAVQDALTAGIWRMPCPVIGRMERIAHRCRIRLWEEWLLLRSGMR